MMTVVYVDGVELLAGFGGALNFYIFINAFCLKKKRCK